MTMRHLDKTMHRTMHTSFSANISDIFMSYSVTLILTASLELTNERSALLFNKLFSNHSDKAFDAFSKDAYTALASSAKTYTVLSSA